MIYCEWYDVCDFVVLSVVEVCADYDGVNVFMFVLILVSSMVLGSVSMFLVYSVLWYVVCFLCLGVVCCVVM